MPPLHGQGAAMNNQTLLDPDMPDQEMRLHMGELTADETRVARAAIRWANTKAKMRVLRVKLLEWTEDTGGIRDAQTCFGGGYRIREYPGMEQPFKVEVQGWNFSAPCGLYPALEDAKSAVQSDYEGRILSALEKTRGTL